MIEEVLTIIIILFFYILAIFGVIFTGYGIYKYMKNEGNSYFVG